MKTPISGPVEEGRREYMEEKNEQNGRWKLLFWNQKDNSRGNDLSHASVHDLQRRKMAGNP
jgi:hypothetical protein